jgi:hypothetical protein
LYRIIVAWKNIRKRPDGPYFLQQFLYSIIVV